MIRTLIKAIMNIYAPKPKIFDQRWVWDIWETGYPEPIKPAWIDKWEREVCYARDQVDVTYLASDRYEQLAKYLDDLDKHRGVKRENPDLPRYIAYHNWMGIVKVERV